jgi:hypothetical protein
LQTSQAYGLGWFAFSRKGPQWQAAYFPAARQFPKEISAADEVSILDLSCENATADSPQAVCCCSIIKIPFR